MMNSNLSQNNPWRCSCNEGIAKVLEQHHALGRSIQELQQSYISVCRQIDELKTQLERIIE